jgi:hypothetical protein
MWLRRFFFQVKLASYLMREAFDAQDWDSVISILIDHFGLQSATQLIQSSAPKLGTGYWDTAFIYMGKSKYCWNSYCGFYRGIVFNSSGLDAFVCIAKGIGDVPHTVSK